MCLGCVTRRGILAAGLAAVSSPALAEPTVEPRFRCIPAAGRRRVALTLDACGGGFDTRIAEALLAQRARATIFATADWLRANPGPLALLRAHPQRFGFENHGAHHVPAVLGGGTLFGLRVAGTLEAVRREVEGGAAAIRAATGIAPRWYRGATARYSPAALEEIVRLGQGIGAYSLNGDEGASLPAAAVERRVAAARDGEVVIGHINQPHRAAGAGLARAIAALAGQGVEWATLDELRPVLA
jgi:peptidoglycan/xylan/chitin deacetylase (PgdA/CDA1 family)